MSDLYYPIGILVAERQEISTSLHRHGDDITKKKERMYDLNQAISILHEEIQRRRNEGEEIEKIKEKEREEEEEGKKGGKDHLDYE